MRQHTTWLGMVLIALVITSCATAAPKAPGAASPATSSPSSIPTERTLGGGSKQIGVFTLTMFSSPNPPVRGNNVLEALIVDANNQSVKDATVSFDIDMTNMSHGKNVVTAKLADNGRYAATLFFMMPGPWRVIVSVQRAGAAVVSDRFNFSVNLR